MKDRDKIYLEKRKKISLKNGQFWCILIERSEEKKGEGKTNSEREKIILFKLVIFQILPSSSLYLRRASHSRNRKHLRPEVSRTIETWYALYMGLCWYLASEKTSPQGDVRASSSRNVFAVLPKVPVRYKGNVWISTWQEFGHWVRLPVKQVNSFDQRSFRTIE